MRVRSLHWKKLPRAILRQPAIDDVNAESQRGTRLPHGLLSKHLRNISGFFRQDGFQVAGEDLSDHCPDENAVSRGDEMTLIALSAWHTATLHGLS